MRKLPIQTVDNMLVEELIREEVFNTRLLEGIAKEIDKIKKDSFNQGFEMGYTEGLEA